MTSTLPTIIFFGTEHSSLTSLKALVEAGYNIAAVVTKPDAPRGRGQKVTEPPVKTFATERGIEVWQPIKLRDIEQEIKSLQPAVGVLVSYGKIIPQSILDLFHPGIINLHPSLLPKWRGPSPIEAAIAARDRETGVSIMKLEAGMDSGPVYQQRTLPLDGSETKQNLYTSLFDMGNQMLVDLLPDILSGKLQPVAQNHHDATYCQVLTKDMSIIDPSTTTAPEAEAKIRAHLGFPRSRINVNGHDLIITKAHVAPSDSINPLALRCLDGNFLVIDELIAPSGKTMSAEAFMRGHQV